NIVFILILIFSLSYAEIGKISEGMSAFNSKDYIKAEKIFIDNISITPKIYILYPYLVNSLYYNGKFKEALNYLDKLKSFGNANANKEYNSMSSEIRAKIYIENKNYDLALKEINKGLKSEKSIVTKNKLFDLKFLVFLMTNNYKSAEKLVKSKPNWDKNPRFLFFMSKLMYTQNKDGEYYRYIDRAWKISKKSRNSLLMENIKKDILDVVTSLKDPKKQLEFIKKIKNINIDFAELNKLKRSIEKDIKFANDLKILRRAVFAKDYSHAKKQLDEMKGKYPADLSAYERIIKTAKKKQLMQYGIIGSMVLVAIVIIIVILSIVKKVKNRKPIPKKAKLKGKKKKSDKTTEEEIEAGVDESNEPKEPEKNIPEELSLENEIEENKKAEAPEEDKIEELGKDEENIEKEEDISLEDHSVEPEKNDNVNKDIADIEIEKEEPLENVHEETEVSGEEVELDELPVEAMEIREDTEESGAINEFRAILREGDAQKEKEFIGSHKDDPQLLGKFKTLYYLHHKQYTKAMGLMKKSDQCMKYLNDYIEEISVSCDTIDKAGICFIYYKNCNDEEKKKQYLEIGKKLINEKN
ncbi:hypothetical protein J7L48_11580, partial [bacterium]|nr:hypothetical protein [bacterium]